VSVIGNIALWYFLPPFLASSLLSVIYALIPTFRPLVYPNSTPQQVSAANARAYSHSRNARIFLVSSYLLYTLITTYSAQDEHFYTVLGLPRAMVERQGATVVKSHWRRLARIYHPDKVGQAGAPYFVILRRAVETLEDETKRWGYERFGVDSIGWEKLEDKRAYLMRGCLASGMFYAVTTVSVVILSSFQKGEGSIQFVSWHTFSSLQGRCSDAFKLSRAVALHLPSHSPHFRVINPCPSKSIADPDLPTPQSSNLPTHCLSSTIIHFHLFRSRTTPPSDFPYDPRRFNE
jgi:hypothetical protein